MNVTVKVEHRDLPAETFEYSQSWFRTGVYEKKPARSVHSVICSVQFGQQERDIVQRSGLLDYVIWQGPEEQYFADDDLKHNLSLRPITKGAFTGSMVALVGFEALVEPDDRPYVRQPLTRRQPAAATRRDHSPSFLEDFRRRHHGRVRRGEETWRAPGTPGEGFLRLRATTSCGLWEKWRKD
jgi:hypothetical protein